MFRIIRPLLFGLVIVAVTTGTARSQYYYPGGYGYGGGGFGGWTGSVEGGVLRGLGSYAQGEGVYNYDTSQGNSINADTSIRLNQYIWNSEIEARHRWAEHQAGRMKMDKAKYQQHVSRLRDNPTPGDIDSGAALNYVLEQLTDPKIVGGSGSALRLADAKIAAATIKEIPFRDETDAITISLDELTDPKSWPLPLRSDAFKPEREAYQKAVDDALAEDKEGGSLKPETVSRVRDAVGQLYRKVDASIPKSKQPDHLQAMNYLKGLAGLSKMLERPNVEAVLSELEKIENTTAGHLIAFMHSYNLRFAPATTTKQMAAYREIYPIMVAQRDKIVGKPSDKQSDAPTPVDNPTAMFHGFDPNHLYPKTTGTAPTPPTAPVPATSTQPKP